MNVVCVGDGAGVGKGRIIAGIIFQNYLEGRKKAIWYVGVCTADLQVTFGKVFVNLKAH